MKEEAGKLLSDAGLGEADLAALLGRSFTLGLSSPNAEQVGVDGTPSVGLKVVTDDVGRAQRTLRALASAASGKVPVFDRVDGAVLSGANTESYLAELDGGSKKLTEAAGFTKALPHHARASASAYLNLRPFLGNLTEGTETDHATFLRALQAVGGQYLDEGSGAGSWLFRVVRS